MGVSRELERIKQTQDYRHKPSGIEWLGDIPEHWEVRRLKKSISFLTDYTANGSFADLAKNVKYQDSGFARLIRLSDLRKQLLNSGIWINEEGYNYLAKSKLLGGELLMANVGAYSGLFCLMPEIKYACSLAPNMYLIRLKKDKLNQNFAFHVLNSTKYFNFFQMLAKSSAQPKLNKDDVKSISIPLPTLEEQNQIAQYLDYKTKQINRFIKNKQKLIKLLKEQKQNIINQAVTKGTNKDVNFKPSGIEWLGDIPEHWEVRRLKSLSQVKRGASPRPIYDPKYFDDNGEYGWVRISDVTRAGTYLTQTKQKLSDLGKSLSVALNEGELFLSIAGSVGKPCISKIKCCVHDGFVYFPSLKEDVKFIYYLFESKRPYEGLGKMGTQLNLNTETVGNICIPLPPLEEQKAIVEYIENETAIIDKAIEKTEREIELIKEYKTTLISEVVTGKKLSEKLTEEQLKWLDESEENNEAENDEAEENTESIDEEIE